MPCRQSGLGCARPERRGDRPGRGKGPTGKGERCKRRTAAERPWLCPAREAGGWAGQREGPGRKGGILQAAHGGRAALAVPGPRGGGIGRAEGRARQGKGERCKRRTAAERPWLCPARETRGWAEIAKGPATNASALPDPFVLCQAGNGDLYRHVGVVVHPWNLKAEHAVKILPIAVNVRQLLGILG